MDGIYYITLYVLFYIILYLVFDHITTLAWEPWLYRIPMARTSAILSSSFSGKVEVDGLSEHLDSRVSDIKGVFCFHPLHVAGF